MDYEYFYHNSFMIKIFINIIPYYGIIINDIYLKYIHNFYLYVIYQ